MLQLHGLVEGLVPVRDTISDRSGGGYRDIASAAEAALSDLQLSCVALYVKGMHIGYRSALPFLASHPSVQGPSTESGALRRLIDTLRSHGVRVGAIAQIHRYDSAAWGENALWSRDDRSLPTQVLAAADCPEFRRRLRLTLHEIVTLFPDLDFLFLEGEAFAAEVLGAPLRKWLSGKGLSFEALADDLTYDPETTQATSSLGIRLDPTWSTEGLAFGVDFTRAAMEVAEETFDDADWKGIRGLVYSPDGPAGRFTPVAAAVGGWWLVPRVAVGVARPKAKARWRACRQHFTYARGPGRRVCVLLELDRTESPAGASEAREIATLARGQLDGLLVAVPGATSPERLVHRLRSEGLVPSRP